MMLFYCSLLQIAISQGITLASSDLSDTLWTVSGWSAITSGGTNVSPYNSISSQCNNQNMLILNNNYLTYQKTYTITDYEFYQLFIELDVYFYQFTQTTINIIVNSQNIYTQQFTSSILTLNNICGTGADSQYTIFQGFYSTQQTLQIQIQYSQNVVNANSFIGIKNLNIYSNGIPLIGGCPMNTPLLSAGSCVTQCTTTFPYLTGQYWNQCAVGANAGSGFKFYYQTNVNNFQFTDNSAVVNSNIYTNSIFHSSVFSSLYQRSDPYYMVNLVGIGSTQALQLNFIFYVFGEWNDGSYVSVFLQGSSIYANNMITISKTNGQYYSSTQSLFYRTNVTQSGVGVVALKTLIGFSGRFFQTAVQMYIKQVLYGGTASYGFGNIVIYKALTDLNMVSKDMYGFPFSCSSGLFAYNGSCVASCPVYSFTSTTNSNCTDYSSSESSIYNSAIPISQNAYGTYIIKLFYQNNFQQSDIDSLFQTKPPTSKNYLNSESFSFIQSKKILGGYNSWGYGTYQATFSNLNAHFQIRFFFTLYLIDGWQVGDTFTYQVDGTVIDTYTANPTIQYQGLSTLDTIHVISGRKVSHGSSTLSISFNCNIAQKDSSKASCGIQNLFVLTDQNVNILCPLSNQFFSYTTQNCENCTTTSCQLFPSNGITAKCSIGCLTCTSSTVCTTCDTSNGYQLSGNVCNCLSNYIIISSICQKCYYQCMTCSGTTSYCTSCDSTRILTSNSCPCNPNYYDIQSITACALITSTCHYSCSTCYGLQYNQCVTCPGSSNRTFQSTSNTCPCDANYSDNGVAQCVSTTTITCHISCYTCNGTLSTNCLTCLSTNFRTLSSNQCPCNNGYADNNFATCIAICSYQCLTCFGNSSTQCSTCPTTRNLIIVSSGTNQSCDCQNGTYNNNVATCATCNSTCKTCTAAGSSSCSSCEPTQNRIQSGSTCPCSTGFNDFQSPGNPCVANYTPCHYSCNTCYGAFNNNCLTCLSTNFRTLSSNSCPCNNGYIDLSIQICGQNYSPCIYSCLTCFGATETQCITCPSTRSLNVVTTGTSQKCDCIDGLYNNNAATCAACDSTCKTCTAAGSSSCSSCLPTSYRTLQGSSCPCSSGYNDILSPGNPCVSNYTPCHYSCSTCFQNQNNNCLSCNGSNHRTLQTATKICQCDTNYSDIGVAACLLNYSPCHNDCLTCYGPASNQCSSCGVGRTINIVSLGVNSSCPCTTNHYYSSGSSCLACDSTCLTCNGGLNNNCISCDSSVFRQLQANTCPCLTGYNELLNPGTCVINYTPCHASCETCFGPSNNQCIVCKSNRSLTLYTCPCSLSFNEVLNPGICVTNYNPCHEQCVDCFGGLNNNCISCDSTKFRTFNSNTNTCPCNVNYIDIGQVLCVQLFSPCHTSCLTCFGDQIYQCVTCPSTRSLDFVSIGHQSCDCNQMYYNVDGDPQCYPCNYTCETCSGNSAIDCLTCNANRIFTSGSCPCIANYNDQIGTLNNCQANYSPCHFSCQSCFGGNNNECLDCPSGSLRTYNNTSYTCDCPAGYDSSQTVCTYICHNTCLTCNGPSQTDCVTCNTAVRQLSGTTCICNNGTNDKLNPPTCVADIISPSCFANYVLTCYGNSNNQALSCDSSVNRILYNNICVCIDGFYNYVTNDTCIQCNPSCKTCNQSTNQNCLTCDTTKNRVAYIDPSNQCPCIPNYNDKLNLDQACVADLTSCHYSCQTCFGLANNQCLTCPSSSFRTLNTNICECNITYGDAGQAVCVLCHSSCLTCNGTSSNQCLTCNSSLNRTLSGSTCPCSNGYNSLANPGQCTINHSPCHYTCDTCYGASSNQCVSCGILSNYHRVYQTDYTCPCDNNYIDLNSQQTCIQLYSPCHYSCNQCIGSTLNDCANCSPTSNRTFNSGQCQCNSGYNDATNQQTCQQNFTPCAITCLTCFGGSSTQCLTCQSPLILNGNLCQCPNVTDVFINNLCYPLITPCHYSCSTCINNLNTGCYQCSNNRIFQIITAPNKVCNCIDGYFEDASNGNICTLCHYSCLTCQTTQQNCLTCSSQKFRYISNNSCPCILNYKEINQNCITCTNTDCLTCDNQQNCLTCVSQIKQVSNGLCICIDGYYQQGSNCYQCDASCLTCDGQGTKQCLTCDNSLFRIIEFGQCVCMTGYQEDSNKQCIDCQSKEGILIFRCQYKNSQDGVWTYGEQCDDGNNDPRDGCDNQMIQPNYSCINIINEPSICYKCPANCIKCIYVDDQVLCSSCLDSYYNAQLSCIKCSDSQCQYCITPSICSVCNNDIIPQNGKCFNCQNGFYQVGYSCQSECGDGIKTINEQCDDGNLQNGDGCSNQCLIEENFVCSTSSSISSCKMNSPPKLQITPVAMRQTNLKRFNIASTQNVQQKNVSLEIISNQSQYITLQYQVQNQSNESVVAPLEIDVNLTFSQSFTQLDVVFVVNGLLNNEFNQDVSSRQLQSPVKDVQIMTNSEKQISSQVAQMGEGSVITFACVSASQLLLGGIQQFIQFLNMIQQLQYIQYINIQFPPNLVEFLNIFNGFTMMPLVKFVYLNNLFTILNTDSFTYVQPQAKFQANGINAYFLENIQGFFMSCLSGFLLNYAFRGLIVVLQNIKLGFEHKRFLFMKQIYNVIKKVQRFLMNSCDLFEKYGLIQLTLASCFDLQFAILMQLSAQNYDDANLTINSLLAYGLLAFYGIIVIKCTSFKDEELNDKVIWQSTFSSIKMIQASIFMFSIINLQDFPQCQVIIISLSSLTIALYTFAFSPLKDTFNNYKLIIQELSIFITNISFIGYIYFPTEINQIYLGWFHIASYGTMILCNLIIETYSNASILKTMCQSKKKPNSSRMNDSQLLIT